MPNGGGNFGIEFRFLGGITDPQKQAFRRAAQQWSRIIVSDVPALDIDGSLLTDALAGAELEHAPSAVDDLRVDDLLIFAEGGSSGFDGPEFELARAGTLALRPDSLIPAVGVIRVDGADLPTLHQEGNLEGVVFHEIGHVLGFGPLWGADMMDLIQGADTGLVFVGEHAMRECATLMGADEPVPVPIESGDGGHWSEKVFGSEIMTPIRDRKGPNPLSRMTIAAMRDMGYDVDIDVAEQFALPPAPKRDVVGAGAGAHPRRCLIPGVSPVVLPRSAAAGADD